MPRFRLRLRLAPALAFAAAISGARPVAATILPPVPPAQASADTERTLTRSEAARIIAAARWIDTTRGVDELRAIDVGGIKQWIRVRGRDRRNPILLFVHGGPGSPMMPASWFFQTPWEEYFTVVQWDQRGAGRTAASNDSATVSPTITMDRMIADGEEVVRYLRTSYGKQKIFLMGHSWGTIIGLNIAQRHPEWLHAYIAMGQVVYGLDNERLGLEFALRAARNDHNQAAVTALEQLAPYPNPDGTIPVDKVLVQRKWVIAYGGLTWGRSDWSYEQNTALLSPDYGAQDLAALSRPDLTSINQLIGPPNKVDYRTTTTFRCPVFVAAGKYDYETVSELARAWYDRIQAPKKGFFWFEHSAHMMPFEEPGKLFLYLVRDVRPLATAAGDGTPAP